MSIATEITRLQNAKAAIKTAIEGKGVTVPDATLMDGMASLIDAIEAGGGDTTVEDSLVTRTVMEYTNSRVTSIGNYAFYWCYNLVSVNAPNVTSLGNYAFQYCSKLTTVDFPKATAVTDSVFRYCYSLTSVSVPLATYVSRYAFQYCSKLTTVDFPKATSIGTYAFANCSALLTADFSQVTKIEYFAFQYCSKLTALVLRNTSEVCSLSGTSVLNYTPIASGTGYIYVPDALVDSYKAATNWSTYAAQIKPLSEYTEA